MGVERTIRDVAMPVLRRLGDDWKAGLCDVAHEHAATEGIRTWLVRSADRAPMPFRRGTVVLACSERDRHTVALEAFAVILRRRGWRSVMLGPAPVTSLVLTAGTVGARAIVVTAQQGTNRRGAIAMLQGVATSQKRGVRVAYAGNAFAAPAARRGVPGRWLGDDIWAAAEILEHEIASSAPGAAS